MHREEHVGGRGCMHGEVHAGGQGLDFGSQGVVGLNSGSHSTAESGVPGLVPFPTCLVLTQFCVLSH